MAFAHRSGIDHVVVAVRDLDGAAAAWQRLGFTVSPRGTHSPHIGTANHTIVLQDDYLELIGVLTATDQNRGTRDFLARREGVERVAFATDDAAAGAATVRAQGLEPIGPIAFGRPVTLPDGRQGEARFNVFRWPLDEQPGGVRIFACQHLTRDMVWIPALQAHANGAIGIASVELVAADALAAARHLGRLIAVEPVETDDGGWRVDPGGHADFRFFTPATFAARYPEAVRVGLAPDGAGAVVLRTRALDRADRANSGVAVAHGGRVSIPAREANGVIVSFVAAA